ncbi:MAG: prepilin-type N-terminal cleavage/methylation domain-containing protein [Massilia sp.]|nr:prepilin-type N-terminal cleavage/methylation domain-containing protein [Massilia sp.]
MRPVRVARRAQAGFTLTEALIALAIIGNLLALGIPNMSAWLQASRASAASEFYAEGFKLARAEALKHNSASRILLTENANGQMDWQVDLCFPSAALACGEETGAWSTQAASAALDPNGAAGFKSVFRAADGLPDSTTMARALSPPGATDVYFTSLGWVDTAFAPRLRRIDLSSAYGHAGAFAASAVVITLAGLTAKCEPNVAASDFRACPP